MGPYGRGSASAGGANKFRLIISSSKTLDESLVSRTVKANNVCDYDYLPCSEGGAVWARLRVRGTAAQLVPMPGLASLLLLSSVCLLIALLSCS